MDTCSGTDFPIVLDCHTLMDPRTSTEYPIVLDSIRKILRIRKGSANSQSKWKVIQHPFFSCLFYSDEIVIFRLF